MAMKENGMRKLGVSVMVGVLAATMYVVAAPAGASVSSKSFCDSIQSAFDSTNFNDSSDGGLGDLGALADGLRAASKKAPKKIKKAMKKMAKYYDLLAGADVENPLENSSNADAQKIISGFITASGTVYAYVAETCDGLDISGPTGAPDLG
jgi:hypothetical protein